MKISVDVFSGMMPKVSPRLLDPGFAQVATDTRLGTGDLQSYKSASNEEAARLGTKSIFLYEGSHWFQWDKEVDAVVAPVSNDTWRRVYFTGTGMPRVTDSELAMTGGTSYPVASYQLGLPPPEAPPTVTLTGSVEDDNPALVESVTYVYTYISKYGEESAPSHPSEILNRAPGEGVRVSGFVGSPSGDFVIDGIRLYRSASSGMGSNFQFVVDLPAGASSYVDEKKNEELGELLPSDGWLPPNTDMVGITMMPAGVMAGFYGQTICFSEPYMPHAWPVNYQQVVDADIVGLGVIGNSLIVLTEKHPYLITGGLPSTMGMTKLGSDEFSCVSKRSIADVPGYGVMYATPDGLAGVNGNSVQLMTDGLMTREQWQEYKPESMVSISHDGRYYAFYDAGGGRKGALVFEPGQRYIYEISAGAIAVYRDGLTDNLFLVDGGQIKKWQGGDSKIPYKWESKKYHLPYPAVFSACQVIAESYEDITLTIGNSIYSFTVSVDSPKPFRLPMNARAATLSITVEGTDKIHTIEIAEDMGEL